jgi:hypothetical protein
MRERAEAWAQQGADRMALDDHIKPLFAKQQQRMNELVKAAGLAPPPPQADGAAPARWTPKAFRQNTALKEREQVVKDLILKRAGKKLQHRPGSKAVLSYLKDKETTFGIPLLEKDYGAGGLDAEP